MDYTPPELDVASERPEGSGATSPVKRLGYSVCQECGVDFPHTVNWPYADYCGDNCFGIAEERVAEIRQNLARRAR